jgi:hypothetical protein
MEGFVLTIIKIQTNYPNYRPLYIGIIWLAKGDLWAAGKSEYKQDAPIPFSVIFPTTFREVIIPCTAIILNFIAKYYVV